MIAGVGNDIVDMRRIRAILLRHPQRFPVRILTNEERREFAARFDSDICEYLAGRLAAKEALAKSLKRGLRSPVGWQYISVLSENGAPSFVFSPSLQSYLRKCGISVCSVSISHDGDYAAAVVIAEKI